MGQGGTYEIASPRRLSTPPAGVVFDCVYNDGRWLVSDGGSRPDN